MRAGSYLHTYYNADSRRAQGVDIPSYIEQVDRFLATGIGTRVGELADIARSELAA